MKILVIGDSCIDEFNYGVCKRLCPEGPVPVFTHSYTVINNGMAGNVEANLIGLGCETTLITNQYKPKKTRYVDMRSNHLIIRVDEEVKGEIERIDINNVINELESNKYDCVIISDYDKGFLPTKSILEILPLAPLVFLDTKKPLIKEFLLHENVWIKINEMEYNNTLASGVDPTVCDRFIVTLGERGCMNKGTIYPPASTDRVRDICGAGDTFLASLAYGYLKFGGNISVALTISNKFCAWCVDKCGVVSINEEAIKYVGLI